MFVRKEIHMSQGKLKIIAAAALLAGLLGARAHAADACITLKSFAEVEQEVVDAKGQKSVKRVPANKVVPGTEVIWTVTAVNTCKQPSENVTINNPVPKHMTLVASSATGTGSDVSYSLDGKSFGKPEQLTVSENGATRPARATEYKHIRWVFKTPLASGATATASFRAVLE
jgi:uncharacterized repeat protein (TIGR01451 family)